MSDKLTEFRRKLHAFYTDYGIGNFHVRLLSIRCVSRAVHEGTIRVIGTAPECRERVELSNCPLMHPVLLEREPFRENPGDTFGTDLNGSMGRALCEMMNGGYCVPRAPRPSVRLIQSVAMRRCVEQT